MPPPRLLWHWPLRLLLFVALALPLARTAEGLNAQPALTLTAGDDGVTVADVATPSGIALLGVTLRTERGVLAERELAVALRDDNGDDTVTYKPAGGVPLRSIWVAVDRQTGSYLDASPAVAAGQTILRSHLVDLQRKAQ